MWKVLDWGFETSLDLSANIRPDQVSSVRIVDEVPRDFRCTICQKVPSSLNRSELLFTDTTLFATSITVLNPGFYHCVWFEILQKLSS